MSRSAPKPPRRSGMLPFYALLGVVLLAGVGVIAWQMNGASAARQPIKVNLTPEQMNRVQGISIGRADAPVVMMEFADFQCPGCAQFAQFMTPLIKERMVQTGQVRYIFYDFPLSIHPNAFLASRAGRCANEQGRFWEYHDYLYGQQSDWAGVTDPTDLFVQYAGSSGADADKFESCLRSDKYAREVSESAAFGESLGVGGTPTLIINGKKIPTPGRFSQLEEVVRNEAGGMGGAAAAPAAGAPAAGATAAPAAPAATPAP